MRALPDEVERRRRKVRPFAIAVLLVICALVAIGTLNSIYVDWLWWSEELKQGDTFRRLLEAEWGWGLLFGLLTLVFMAVNLFAARRLSLTPIARPTRYLARIAAAFLLFLAARSGFGFGVRHWPEILLWKHRQMFGVTEPIFGRDAGFYVFTLPLLRQIGDWAIGLLVFTAAAVIAVYLIRAVGRLELLPTGARGAYRVAVEQNDVPGGFWNRLLTHLSLLGVALFLAFAFQAQLASWGLLYSRNGVVYGPGWTDVHVVLPALRVMMVALLVGAAFLVAAVFAHTLRATLRAIQFGLGLVILVWFVGLNLLPGLVQRYKVSPNETTLEIPYIRNNMAMTREAFGLTEQKVETRDFPPVQPMSAAGLVADSLTLANMRLWDWRALELTYDQNQSFRQYYDFVDVDIDRYSIDGTTRQVMLALREMNTRAFSENALTWVNLRQIYTHGYGLCLNPTNEFTAEGLPDYWVRDIPPQATRRGLEVSRPEIYFGEMTEAPVYVNTGQKEFDYPKGEENSYARYAGQGGIRIGSGLRRLALALRFDGIRQLTAADLTPESRLIFRRQVRDRVSTLAPFLQLDDDPYAVLVDGRLKIILDAYTTSDHFPYSERLRRGLNYIRNSVKVVVDCYDGTVDFYAVDESDPILKAWRAAFPNLIRPRAEVPPSLVAHFRYPEDLLDIQSHVYATYHMKDPLVFYNKEDRWAIARESLGQADAREMLPYYAVMRLPGEKREEFVHMIPFTPYTASGTSRNNMVGWMAGRCDGEHYGKLLVYRFPKQSLVYGPMQIEARIDQDAVISKDLTLWNQQGSNVIRGNLIVVPLEDALLYTKPIFLQATHSKMPELKRVVVASQERLGYGASFAEALANLVEEPLPSALAASIGSHTFELGNAGIPAPSGAGGGSPEGSTPLARARESYRRYLDLMGKGKVREAGEELERLGKELEGVRP